MGRDIHSHTTVYKDGSHTYKHRAELPILQEGKIPVFWYYITEPEGQWDWSESQAKRWLKEFNRVSRNWEEHPMVVVKAHRFLKKFAIRDPKGLEFMRLER